VVTFRCYISGDGVDQIKVWFGAQDDAVQADLLAVMETLEAIDNRDRWPESCFKELENRKGSQCEGLIELILEDENRVQFRIFGFSGPRDDDFTMLLPLRKNDDPTYKRSCQEAQKRKAEVANDWSRAREWEA
jgi:Phage derived protein Gp49-like (DUF891)